MFNDIPGEILDRMQELEEIDRRDRTDGTPRLERLRQIPPATGRFLALLAATAPAVIRMVIDGDTTGTRQ